MAWDEGLGLLLSHLSTVLGGCRGGAAPREHRTWPRGPGSSGGPAPAPCIRPEDFG